MSIESLLTLVVTVGLLVAGLIIRFVVMGLWRLGLLLSGRDAGRPDRAPAERRPRDPVWPRIASGARSVGAATAAASATVWRWMVLAGRGVGVGTMVVTSEVGRGVRAAATGLDRTTRGARRELAKTTVVAGRELGSASRIASKNLGRGTKSAIERLRPHIVAAYQATRRGAIAVGGWIKPRVVLVIATVVHVARAGAAGLQRWWRDVRVPREPVGAVSVKEEAEVTVIDLRREWDPLTDEFPPDERVSSRL